MILFQMFFLTFLKVYSIETFFALNIQTLSCDGTALDNSAIQAFQAWQRLFNAWPIGRNHLGKQI